MAKPIVHIEIPASDTKEAATFYNSLFDWKLEHDANFDYWQFEAGEGPGGGFVKIGEEGSSGVTRAGDVLIYIDTDDIEATLARAESLGAKILTPKTEIPGVGWFGVFSDPSGNRMALYTSASPQP
jgi:predicted enzyme related to lactoylglutathione lyase